YEGDGKDGGDAKRESQAHGEAIVTRAIKPESRIVRVRDASLDSCLSCLRRLLVERRYDRYRSALENAVELLEKGGENLAENGEPERARDAYIGLQNLI